MHTLSYLSPKYSLLAGRSNYVVIAKKNHEFEELRVASFQYLNTRVQRHALHRTGYLYVFYLFCLPVSSGYGKADMPITPETEHLLALNPKLLISSVYIHAVERSKIP